MEEKRRERDKANKNSKVKNYGKNKTKQEISIIAKPCGKSVDSRVRSTHEGDLVE